MLDAATMSFQRAHGRAEVTVSGSGNRLERLYQSGSAKAFLPRVHVPVPEVVFLNTAGGLTGGDQMSFALKVGAGASVTGTTQTAERAYRAIGGPARVDVTLHVEAGGCLHWLPQETILFDGSRVNRLTSVDLSEGAEVLLCEMTVLGRKAMGETVSSLAFQDVRRITKEGRPIFVDPFEATTETLAQGGPALLQGAEALATLVWVSDRAEDALHRVRAVTATHEVTTAVSAWDGRLVLRALAADARALRHHIIDIVEVLRGGPLPRVWQR